MDGRTDEDYVNSRSYCVAARTARSANNFNPRDLNYCGYLKQDNNNNHNHNNHII